MKVGPIFMDTVLKHNAIMLFSETFSMRATNDAIGSYNVKVMGMD